MNDEGRGVVKENSLRIFSLSKDSVFFTTERERERECACAGFERGY